MNKDEFAAKSDAILAQIIDIVEHENPAIVLDTLVNMLCMHIASLPADWQDKAIMTSIADLTRFSLNK